MILANTLPWMKWMALLMFYSEKVPILRYTLKHVENPPPLSVSIRVQFGSEGLNATNQT